MKLEYITLDSEPWTYCFCPERTLTSTTLYSSKASFYCQKASMSNWPSMSVNRKMLTRAFLRQTGRSPLKNCLISFGNLCCFPWRKMQTLGCPPLPARPIWESIVMYRLIFVNRLFTNLLLESWGGAGGWADHHQARCLHVHAQGPGVGGQESFDKAEQEEWKDLVQP